MRMKDQFDYHIWICPKCKRQRTGGTRPVFCHGHGPEPEDSVECERFPVVIVGQALTEEMVDRAYDGGPLPRSGPAMVHREVLRNALLAAGPWSNDQFLQSQLNEWRLAHGRWSDEKFQLKALIEDLEHRLRVLANAAVADEQMIEDLEAEIERLEWDR